METDYGNFIDEVSGLVIPILSKSEWKSSIGSCFILGYEDFFYLISAAHVLKHISEINSVFIPTNDSFQQLHINKNANYFKNDELDVAIVNILDSGNKVIKTENLWLDQSYSPQSHYLFLGFPSSKNKLIPTEVRGLKRKMIPRPIFIGGYSVNEEKMERYEKEGYVEEESGNTIKLNREYHIAIDYNLLENEKIKCYKGNIDKPIKPHGMSGGAIWKVDLDSSTKQIKSYNLAGVITSFDKQKGALIGVRISKVIEGIRKAKFSFEVE